MMLDSTWLKEALRLSFCVHLSSVAFSCSAVHFPTLHLWQRAGSMMSPEAGGGGGGRFASLSLFLPLFLCGRVVPPESRRIPQHAASSVKRSHDARQRTTDAFPQILRISGGVRAAPSLEKGGKLPRRNESDEMGNLILMTLLLAHLPTGETPNGFKRETRFVSLRRRLVVFACFFLFSESAGI